MPSCHMDRNKSFRNALERLREETAVTSRSLGADNGASESERRCRGAKRSSGGIRGDHKSGKLKYIPSSPFGAPEFKNTAACCK